VVRAVLDKTVIRQKPSDEGSEPILTVAAMKQGRLLCALYPRLKQAADVGFSETGAKIDLQQRQLCSLLRLSAQRSDMGDGRWR
jgi:hypothetical protein